MQVDKFVEGKKEGYGMLNERRSPAGRGSIEIDSGRRTPAGRHILNEHPLTKLLSLFACSREPLA